MQADHQQPWKLNIQAKSNKFQFNLKTNKLFLPSSKFFNFSFKFKIHHLLISVKSKPQSSFASKFNSLNSKFLQAIKKLQIRRSNRTQGSNNGGHLSRLCRTISRKEPSRIIKYGSIIMMFLCSRFYSFLRWKRFKLSLVLVIGMLISGSISSNNNIFAVAGGYISSYFTKAKAIVPLLEFIFTFL